MQLDAGAGDIIAGHACLMQFDTGLAGFIFLEPVKLNLPEDNSAKHDRSHKCRLPVQNIMGGMAGIAGRDMRIGLARKAADLIPQLSAASGRCGTGSSSCGRSGGGTGFAAAARRGFLPAGLLVGKL